PIYASSFTSTSLATRPAHSGVRALRASSITGGLNPVLARSRRSHCFLRALQHARSGHVLPPTITDIHGKDFIVAGHQPNSIGQATIVCATAGLHSLEIVE